MVRLKFAFVLVGEHLGKTYGLQRAVDDVTFKVARGRIVGLVGANGAGKTTTIKMTVGILEPTQGRIELDGVPTLRPETRKRIGYLPEESALYEDMTALAYLEFFGGMYDLPRAGARERAKTLLERLNLDSRDWKRPLGQLSRGMRRKVAICRSVLHEPALLVLDEPTGDLDPFTNAEVEGFLRELRGQGKAILLSAHNLKQVESLCDDILVMHRGRLVTHGTLDDLRRQAGGSRYLVRATHPFPGSAPDGAQHLGTFKGLSEAEAALDHVKRTGGTVIEVTSLPPSLEEIMRRAARGPDG